MQLIKDMLYPARFLAVKAPEGSYEQRLRDAEKYSGETISSLLEKARVDVEGSDAVVVNEEVQAAASALENFIYETEDKGEPGGEKEGENTEENAGESQKAAEEKDAPAQVKETNGETTQETAQEAEDQQMKEGPSIA